MASINAEITYKKDRKVHQTTGQRLIFSPNRCFSQNGDLEDQLCLDLITHYLRGKSSLAIAGDGAFAEYFLNQRPEFKAAPRIRSGEPVPAGIRHVFIAETLTVPRMSLRKKLGQSVEVSDPMVLVDLAPLKLPLRGWSQDPDTIYPMEIPEIEFERAKDFILIDCPSRNLALMPNGLAYVHNALKKTSVSFQTVDLDIIIYHRYHTLRLLDAKGPLVTPTGRKMHADPWLTEAYDEWMKADTLAFFESDLAEIVRKLVAARPKILGVSVQACNLEFSRELVRRVKASCPEMLIVVGGYSCYRPNIGLKVFPEADYMCIGEADLTVGPLIESLARGERPKDLPGVIAKSDTADRKYVPGPMPHELDQIAMAKYDWTDLKLYRNFNHFQLTPIIATRGCRWSKCTFCGERFFWRARNPKLVVDEFEYFHDQGCDTFVFNESDLNGNPKVLLEICEEIRRRKLKLRLNGQLRVSRHSDRKFFDSLKAGGFTVLRFGVDAWSENTLKLQKKGYTVPMIIQNLKDCHEAGIYTEVNTVLGIPGETDQDIQQTIELKGICKPYVGRIANINKLMLVNGSVYWEEPEKHGIIFRGASKEELYERFPSIIPAEYWYSDNPYIDENVRVERFRRVVEGLEKFGYNIGEFAKLNIDKIEEEFKAPAPEPQEKRERIELPMDSVVAIPKVNYDVPTTVFATGGEFYGIFPSKETAVVATVVADDKVRAPGELLDNVKGPATPAGHEYLRKAKHVLRTSQSVWRTHGPKMVLFMVRTRLNNKLQNWWNRVGLREGSVVVRRDYSGQLEIGERHPSGYVILKARDTYYAIRSTTPFDKERADRNGYPKGVCFRGPTGRSVYEQLEQHTSFVN